MLTFDSGLIDDILDEIHKRCSSLRKCQRVVVLILRRRKVKSTMGDPLSVDEILTANKMCQKLVQDSLRKDLEHSSKGRYKSLSPYKDEDYFSRVEEWSKDTILFTED